MTDGFNVVAVGVKHEGAVVVGVIMRAQARRAIVASAGRERRLVERINRCAIVGLDRDMHWLVEGAFAADPEIRLAVGAKACGVIAGPSFLHHFHDKAVAERRQGLGVESLGARIIGNRKADVVDHQSLPQSWIESVSSATSIASRWRNLAGPQSLSYG